jgi:hypothetical protein
MARAHSQEELADVLGLNQATISKLVRRTDMYLSSLRLPPRDDVSLAGPPAPNYITPYYRI